EAHLLADAMVDIDEVNETSVEYGSDGVGEHRILHGAEAFLGAGRFRLRFPIFELAPSQKIARLGKGRDPLSSDKHRVPTDVIDMEVGADDRVDAVTPESGGFQIPQERKLEIVPIGDGGARLVVADTGVDENASRRRFDDESVNAE